MAKESTDKQNQQSAAPISQIGVTPTIGAGHPAIVQNIPHTAGSNFTTLKITIKGKDTNNG